jgi:transporter family-2 protein
LGLVIVAIITIAVPVAGVLLVTLALVAGQLLGSLALDVVVPVDGRTPTWWSAAGALLLMAAVALASRPSRGSRAAAWKDDRS